MAPDRPTPRHAQALVVMARVPRAGRCKTRLCPPLLPEDAARVYEAFLRDIARETAAWRSDCDRWLAWVDDPDGEAAGAPAFGEEPPEPLRAIFADGFDFLPQRGGTLAERMDAVFGALFGLGYARVVMRNSDSPHLPPATADEAFALLAARPGRVVLGPDLDGGYYLVGLDGPPQALFPRTMGTRTVLEETVELARAAGREPALLPPFPDIDTPDDLATFWLEFGGRADVGHWATRALLADGELLDRLESRP